MTYEKSGRAHGAHKSKLNPRTRSKIESCEMLIQAHRGIVRALMSDQSHPEAARRSIEHDRESVNVLLARIQAAEDRLAHAPELIRYHQELIQGALHRLELLRHSAKLDELKRLAAEIGVLVTGASEVDDDETDDETDDEIESKYAAEEDDETSEDEAPLTEAQIRAEVDAEVELLWATAMSLEHADDEATATTRED